ncbi:hypothetical protein VTI28DRAFT_9937 [Corynascus sepedonium]
MRLESMPTAALLTLLTFYGALPSLTLAARGRPKDAILLSEVQSLTLHGPNQMTTSRRVPPIPQLRCVSPRALCRLASRDITTMRCINQGAAYTSEDIAWSCTSPSLPRSVRLDRTDVICEGYNSPDDAYVLRGSCGVEYTLRLTDEGRREYPELVKATEGGGLQGDWWAWLFWVAFFAVLAWMAYSAWTGRRLEGRPLGGNNRRGWGGGGGGGGGWGPGPGWGPGGGGGWDDPPPPYPGFGPKPSSSTEPAWRPGFWSGLASGAAAGYMAGNLGQRNQDRNRVRGGAFRRNDDDLGGFRRGSARGIGRRPTPDSGERHESTGFGSTTRR